jgi:hypothetical protein
MAKKKKKEKKKGRQKKRRCRGSRVASQVCGMGISVP